jgi:hypothetical protein
METLSTIVQSLDNFLAIEALDQDRSFSLLLPMVYENAGIEWRSLFDPLFCRRFNGIMPISAIIEYLHNKDEAGTYGF